MGNKKAKYLNCHLDLNLLKLLPKLKEVEALRPRKTFMVFLVQRILDSLGNLGVLSNEERKKNLWR